MQILLLHIPLVIPLAYNKTFPSFRLILLLFIIKLSQVPFDGEPTLITVSFSLSILLLLIEA